MAGTTFTKYDKNRYRKIYPINRRPEKPGFRSSAEIVIETVSLTFNNEITRTGVFEERYNQIPSIVFSSSTTGTHPNANVNLFISSIEISNSGRVQFTIEASDNFTGEVAVQTISVVKR